MAPNESGPAAQVQFLARRLHRLGEKPLFHFLDELAHGADLRETLETYAARPADLIRVYGGDKFAANLFTVSSG